ncbi:hypothetical protein D3C84_1072320 [compost metagenome]
MVRRRHGFASRCPLGQCQRPGFPIVVHASVQQRGAHSPGEGGGLRIDAIVEGVIPLQRDTVGAYHPQVFTACG